MYIYTYMYIYIYIYMIKTNIETLFKHIYIIYIYIYILYINFKAINNALDSKMVLKTHFFIKNISLSLQKLRQYNKSLPKHQTKINTAVITNQLKLQKN